MVAAAQAFGLPSAFPGILAGSCSRSRAAGLETATPVWDAGIPSSHLTCASTPASKIYFHIPSKTSSFSKIYSS